VGVGGRKSVDVRARGKRIGNRGRKVIVKKSVNVRMVLFPFLV
jgi:hypothetical protein